MGAAPWRPRAEPCPQAPDQEHRFPGADRGGPSAPCANAERDAVGYPGGAGPSWNGHPSVDADRGPAGGEVLPLGLLSDGRV